jgi:hypothetical protein
MSRTLKDRPPRVRFPEVYPFFDGERTKKRKEIDHVWHWLQATPSWWTNLFMNRPQRREAQQWEREIQKVQNLEELEDVETPNVSKKPHKYYW